MQLQDRGAIAALFAVIACSIGVALIVVTPQISLDDPFIGLRYGTNLLAGDGLVYNPGQYVEGYTAFLWIMVATVAMALGIEPLAWWQFWSLVANAITLCLIYRLGRRPDRSPWFALVAPALLAVHIAFVAHVMMGMSASFFTMLVTLAVYMLDRGITDHRRGSFLWAALLMTICLTRFDGLIIVGVLLLPVLFNRLVIKRDIQSTMPIVVVLGVGLVVYNGWRFAYYGDLLPNTFYCKVTTFMQNLEHGWMYAKLFAHPERGGPFLLLVALLPVVVLTGRASKTVVLAAWVAVGHLGYVFVVGGDWMPFFRFILPVLPLLCLLLQESVWGVWKLAVGAVPSVAARAALGAVVAVLLAVNVVPLVKSRYVQRTGDVWSGPYVSPVDVKIIGEHLNDRLPADAHIALEWAGILAFYMKQPVFDIFGLSDKDITNGQFPGGRMGRAITHEFLVTRKPKPHIVIYCGRVYPTLAEAEQGTDVRGSSEKLWINWFYATLANDPKWGYENCVMKIGEGYWPFLVRSDWEYKDELCFKSIPRGPMTAPDPPQLGSLVGATPKGK